MMLSIAAIAAAVLVAACARSGEHPAAVVPTGRTNATADAQVVPASYGGANASTDARPVAFRAEFTAEPREDRAGAPPTLAFTVKNSSG
ncbi:MAG TPA: hypothetical protein VM943_05650, partial [Pyrinomonadaceae bacterium]|nr:hypothetical protein [Pyrinomonadaceae bacterium]